MAPSRRTLSIALALLISASFITAGYALSSGASTLSAGATSTEELMREYAKRDTDADGLPDWKESLYGADPANPRSLDPSMTDKEAVDSGKVEPKFRSAAPAEEQDDGNPDNDFTVSAPGKGSVTDEFAKAFFESYMNSINGEMAIGTPDEAFITGLAGDVNARLASKLTSSYKESDVTKAPAGSESAYLVTLETALTQAAVPGVGSDPITLIDRFVTKGDATAKPELEKVARNYRTAVGTLKEASVPSSLVTSHVALVRTLEQLAGATETVVNFNTDPLATVGGLAVYEPAYREMYIALSSLSSTLVPSGTAAGGAGAVLLEFTRILSIFKP